MTSIATRFALSTALLVSIAVSSLVFVPAAGAVGNVVISQVYGGGGSASSTYKCDYVELFNRSASSVDISGWSVQYAAATGTSWSKVIIPAATNLGAGAYYLVQLQCGATGLDIPANCVSLSSTSISMAAASGKVALVMNSTTLTGSGCPLPATLSDFVGYGSADCFEGTPTAVTSATSAARRGSAGYQDTDFNANDFSIGAPLPCALPTPVAPSTWGRIKTIYR